MKLYVYLHITVNPIEMAWSQIKHYGKTHNREFTLYALERLVNEGFAQVTPERWTSLIKHTQEKESGRCVLYS